MQLSEGYQWLRSRILGDRRLQLPMPAVHGTETTNLKRATVTKIFSDDDVISV